jgi:hypothetical protein
MALVITIVVFIWLGLGMLVLLGLGWAARRTMPMSNPGKPADDGAQGSGAFAGGEQRETAGCFTGNTDDTLNGSPGRKHGGQVVTGHNVMRWRQRVGNHP